METDQSTTSQNLNGSEIQPQQTGANNKLFAIVAVSILLSAVVTGSTVYFWQKSANEKVVHNLKQKVSSLQENLMMSQVNATPQPQISPPVSTENWETYRNEDVTFQYPSQWISKPILIPESGITQEFIDPEGTFVLTFVKNENYNQVTGEPYTSIDKYVGLPYKVKPVTIDDQEGRQPLPRAGSENINSVVFFSKDSKIIYTLELQTGSIASGNAPSDASEADMTEGQQLFDQLISTFRFTN